MTELIHPTAERTVAAAIAKGNDESTELLSIVTTSDFSNQTLQVIVEASKRLLLGIEPMDAQAILAEARAFMKETKLTVPMTEPIIAELIKLDTRRAPAYAHTVKRYAWLRQFRDTIDWANQELANLPDPDELFTAANERLAWLKPPVKEGRFVYGWDTSDYNATLTKREADAAQGKTVTFDYPWKSWNDRAKPLRSGMVGLLAGPEGSGKSGYLEMIAEHWASKGHVIFVHLENNHEYTIDRRMSRWSHVMIEALETNKLDAGQRLRVSEANRQLASIVPQLHYMDAAGMSMAEIVTELRARKGEGLCDAVVLDYINKVRSSRGQVKLYGDKLDARQADDLEQFKNFCETPGAKVVGFTAAQYTKQGKQNHQRKQSADIRGTGEFADKAQLIVMLDRVVLESPLKDPTGRIIANAGEDDPVIKVRIDKQNRGKKQDFEQVHRGEFFEIRDKEYRNV